MSRFEVVPITGAEALAFIAAHHRTHDPPHPGHYRFVLGLAEDGRIVGVATVGRPKARGLDDGWTAEVNRACTDGTLHANSALYAACWKAAQALGFRRLITYTLPAEGGASLRAAGWKMLGTRGSEGGRSWDTPTRPRVDHHPTGQKLLWEAGP